MEKYATAIRKSPAFWDWRIASKVKKLSSSSQLHIDKLPATEAVKKKNKST